MNRSFITLLTIYASCYVIPHLGANAASLRAIHDESAGTISVYRGGSTEPILTQNALQDFRPYIHPLVAPDGRGLLTDDLAQ